jgi:hypothetical protein
MMNPPVLTGCAECHYEASVRNDSLAERSEFELPVPVSKLSYDSTKLGFGVETDWLSVITPHRVYDVLVFVVGSGGAKMGLPLFGTQLQN